ncbi:MAG: phenylalanine--tRNA ligase subunit alpha [Bacteroidetes bacterium QS_8_68_28]|nr:MAG: phenylalanine--tRNA ligase subunit alpha [Bacteroidetes bacterium QS_8_68_28]
MENQSPKTNGQRPASVESVRREMEAETIENEDELETFRVEYLGRKRGKVGALFDRIPELDPEERPAFGKAVNALKEDAQAKLDAARERLQQEKRAAGPDLDLTLPGRPPMPAGSLHPLRETLGEVSGIFERFGFSVAEGPEIEDDWHNFGALNFPPDHPARDMQDTFFLKKHGYKKHEDAPTGDDSPQQRSSENQDVVLRTHTSPMQIRVMETDEPPFRVVVPGRVYRNEALSYKSYCLFYQVEGLYVDEGVSMGHLKQTLSLFARSFFGEAVETRFRPSYFPFTEPSAEMDIWWDAGAGMGGQWMEILGCGMVHPHVLESADVDPERYTGYAFGMGIDRVTMLRHDVTDIRTLYENDVRFLRQF